MRNVTRNTTDRSSRVIFYWQILMWGLALVLFLILALQPVKPARAASSPVYTIAKVRLDVRADNAVIAKKQALREGPLIALKLIFRRFAPFRAWDRLQYLTSDEADDVIDGFAVRSERNSSTRYLALLDYNFSRKRLQALFVKKGIPFTDRRSRKQVLMPVFFSKAGDPQDADLEKNRRAWWRAWRIIDFRHGLTDTRLYKPKEADQQAWQKIVEGQFSAFQDMRQNYAARKLVLVDAQLNEKKDKITFRLFGEDARGPVDYSQQMPVEHDLPETYEHVAAIAYGILEGRWREPQIHGEVVAVSTQAGASDRPDVDAVASSRRLVEETVFMRVMFRGLRDWQQIRKRLSRIPGVQKMQVNSLSPRGADVRMNFPGGATHLQSQLASYGFAIEQNGKDLVLRSLQR